jgi:heme/copper-type cytochrome/quinol oxidase subunit 3
MADYQPPTQSKRGQLIDAATVLVLIFATLFGTTYLVQEAETSNAPTRPLAELPINNTERAQYQKVIDSGTADLASVNASVAAHQDNADKYDVNVWALLGTTALLAAYLGFVYRTSFREYREVINERFGPPGPSREGAPE